MVCDLSLIHIYESSDPLGSKTKGLQNYDDLYADVLLWAREGWIDYNIPQIYWHKGHPVADYETLVKWDGSTNPIRTIRRNLVFLYFVERNHSQSC